MADDNEVPFHEEEPEPNEAPARGFWDSDEMLESLKMERSLAPEESNAQLTKRLFEQAAPQAAVTLINLAQHATNENTRLNAAKYVTERVLGKIGDGEDTEETPLEKILGEMYNTIEQHANRGH